MGTREEFFVLRRRWFAGKAIRIKVYCVLCEKLFPVSHGGPDDVKAHQKGKIHTVLEEFKKFLQYRVSAAICNRAKKLRRAETEVYPD